MLEERGACNWGLRLPPNLRKLVFSSVEVKKRQTDNRGDCQSVAVLRAGVEPAQVSLSVFETDASTDSAIGALGVCIELRFVGAKIHVFLKPTKPSGEKSCPHSEKLLFSAFLGQ